MPTLAATPPASRAEVVSRALDAMPIGQIGYNQLTEMTVGQAQRLEVFLIQSESLTATQTLTSSLEQSSGIPQIQPIHVSTWMTVRLSFDEHDFQVIAQHKSDRQAVGTKEPTNWSWLVTPLIAGERTIYIRATKEAEAEGEIATSDLPPTVIRLVVQVNPLFTAQQYWWLALVPIALFCGFVLVKRWQTQPSKNSVVAIENESINLTAATQTAKLRRFLVEHFSMEDLKTLCQDLNINFDNLGAETLEVKARELADYARRHEKLPDVIEAARSQRPKASWETGQSFDT